MTIGQKVFVCLLFFGLAFDCTFAQSDNAPAPRNRHTAVWTGKEMIVWGGYNGSSNLNSGGRFDPVANKWMKVSNAGAPISRSYHTAVWTGTQMIVWGGSDSINSLSSGGHYDPATDTWTLTGAAPPTSRYYHSSVWTGVRMIVWGGVSGTGAYRSDAGEYSPYAWSAIATAGAPAGRSHHTAVWIGNANPFTMIVWGGFNGSGYLNTGGQYSPFIFQTWTAVSTAGAPTGRNLHTAVWTGTEMIVWGGYNGSTRLDNGGRYDPVADSWAPIASTSAPSARSQHTAIWTGKDMIVWGGWGGISGSSYFNDGAKYNPATDTWTAVSNGGAPQPRYNHTAVWTGTEMIVWGGYNSSSRYLNDGARYNPESDTWTAVPTNPPPLVSISLTDSNTVVVAWSSPAVGHWLEQNSDLNATNWTSVNLISHDDGITTRVLVPTGQDAAFFRLK